MDTFEPTWKEDTVSIRRSLQIITLIRDEFLDQNGKVIKELRFEKRTSKAPYTVIPEWRHRTEQVVAVPEQGIVEQEPPGLLSQLDILNRENSPPCEEANNARRSSHESRHHKDVQHKQATDHSQVNRLHASASSSRVAILEDDDAISVRSDASSVCSDNCDIERVDIDCFAYWDWPKTRTSRRMKTETPVYIPVYVVSESNKPKKVNVSLSPDGSKRRAARKDDLIFLRELDVCQQLQYWKDKRICNIFPDVQNISDKGSQLVGYCSSDIVSGDGGLNLMLTVVDVSKRSLEISFWNTALPSKASLMVMPHIRNLAANRRGLLPESILAEKRHKGVGQKRTLQSTLIELGDPEDDNTSVSKRSQVSEDTSASERHDRWRTTDDPETRFPVMLPRLHDFSTIPNLFANYDFGVFTQDNENKFMIENFIRECGGSIYVPNSRLFDSSKPHQIAVADHWRPTLFFSNALLHGIPIVNLSWIIDCLSRMKVVDIDPQRHLIMAQSQHGYFALQPYEPVRRKRTFLSGLNIGVCSDDHFIGSSTSEIVQSLGGNAITISLSKNDQELRKDLDGLNYVIIPERPAARKTKARKLLTINNRLTIATLEWIIDNLAMDGKINVNEHRNYLVRVDS